jgi:SprB repeat
MQRKSILPIFLISFFCLQTSLLLSQVIYVDANVQGGIQDGTSWANAFTGLQEALGAAQSGDEVWVAQGTYYPTASAARNISFEIPGGVALYGGFSGSETSIDQRDWALYPTTLSGDTGTQGDDSDNSFTVVYIEYADSSTVVDGFVIIGGNANSQSPLEPAGGRAKNGGGMYIYGTSQAADTRPVIRNCTFRLNNARIRGGAVYINGASGGSTSPRFQSCHFEENTASLGGALYKDGGSYDYDMLVTDCTFLANLANQGGAVNYLNSHGEQDFVFQDCLFQDNYALTGGGAVHQDVNHPQGKLIFTNCDFVFNATEGDGGAIEHYNFAGSDALFIDSCKFTLNFAFAAGTIMSIGEGLIEMNNSIFENNLVYDEGGCFNINESSLKAANCIFFNSEALEEGSVLNQSPPSSGAESKICFINCIFFSNQSPYGIISCWGDNTEIKLINSVILGNSLNGSGKLILNSSTVPVTLTFSHTLLDVPDCASISNGPVTCGPGMLYNLDPLFADTAAHDFRLLPCSPTRDAGDNAIVDSLGLLTDIAGSPRIQGGTVDMGAYESPAFAATATAVLPALCHDGEGSVSLGLGTGCPPFFLDWDGPGGTTGSTISDTAFVILEGPAGLYTITVTDGRMDSDTIAVEITAPPQLTAATTATDIVCPGGPGGTVTTSVTGGTAPYSWLWSNADTTATPDNLPAGMYTVTVTDSAGGGCTLTDSVAVETSGNLTLSIDVTPTHCSDSNDGTAAITPLDGTGPFAWLWQDDSADSLLTGLGGGSYSVTVTDALGCTDELQFSMTAPDTLVAAATGTDALCFGEATGTASVTATGGTGAYEYDWSNAMTTPAIGQLPPGWYSVTVTGVNQCMDTASVFIASPPALGVAVEATVVLCFGAADGTAAAPVSGGTPPYSFEWATGQTDSLLTGLPPGGYAVTVSDGNGCTGEAGAFIDSSAQLQILIDTILSASDGNTTDGAVLIGTVFGGTPPYTYQWSNGAVTQSLEGVLPGPYTLTVTDADSCQNVFYFTVDVASAAGEEKVLPFQAVIVPNPSGAGGAALWLETARPQMLTLQVFDGLGRVLFSKEAFATAGESRRDLPPGLPPGVYWVAVRNGDGALRVLRWVVM